jgi:hypothetical protein
MWALWRIYRGICLALSVLMLAPTYGGCSSENHPNNSADAATAQSFVVFDAMSYANKPDVSPLGMRPITLLYPSRFWRAGEDRTVLPQRTIVDQLAQQAKTTGYPVVIDIEHWPVQGDAAVVADSVSKYRTVVEWFRAGAPDLPVGLYGVPPIRAYWRAIKGSQAPEYQSWQAENYRLHDLSRAVPVLFPSLYTFYDNQTQWVRYAIENIAEARRANPGVPVYVFLWPQYHNSNATLGYQYLSQDYWQLELETARRHADGLVIWVGSGADGRLQTWDESAPWWQATKQFMAALRSTR